MSTCTYTTAENGVAVMTIDNPPMNALNTGVINDINAAVKKALADDDVRVVVFTGAGKAFIAGADIREIDSLSSKNEGSAWLENGQNTLNLIENADKPFIAAINGFALGGGTELALACHIRIADETAKMGLPEIKLGIIPGFGGTQRTPRIIGKARAYELILSGNFIDCTLAAEYGLVNRTAPKGESLKEAVSLADAIALRGRPAIIRAIKSVREGYDMEFGNGQALEREMFGELCETDNKKEGTAAFLEKRDPRTLDT